MSTWILVITIFVGSDTAVRTIPGYHSQEECQKAIEGIISHGIKFTAECKEVVTDGK